MERSPGQPRGGKLVSFYLLHHPGLQRASRLTVAIKLVGVNQRQERHRVAELVWMIIAADRLSPRTHKARNVFNDCIVESSLTPKRSSHLPHTDLVAARSQNRQ